MGIALLITFNGEKSLDDEHHILQGLCTKILSVIRLAVVMKVGCVVRMRETDKQREDSHAECCSQNRTRDFLSVEQCRSSARPDTRLWLMCFRHDVTLAKCDKQRVASWNRAVVENPPIVQLLWDLRTFYENRRFVTGPPLWSKISWLQLQRSEFDYRRCQIFWEVVGLERGSLSLVSTTEELLERKSSGSGLEIRAYGHMGSTVLYCSILLH
jgi:hypothetical protein